jgi:hypothetical protein
MSDGRAELRKIALHAIESFIGAVERQHGNAPVGSQQLRALAASLAGMPSFAAAVDAQYGQMIEVVTRELLHQKRTDPFQRLVVHPLSAAFQDGLLSRDILPNYFSFIHLVMGDQITALSSRCIEICAELQREHTTGHAWDAFYDDPGAEQVMWTVLVRISESFRRFDARRDWFIGLMQYTPQAVSIANNAFLPLHHVGHGAPEKPRPPFAVAEFNILFSALFGPLRHLSATQQRRFENDFGVPSERVFGPLLSHLDSPARSL